MHMRDGPRAKKPCAELVRVDVGPANGSRARGGPRQRTRASSSTSVVAGPSRYPTRTSCATDRLSSLDVFPPQTSRLRFGARRRPARRDPRLPGSPAAHQRRRDRRRVRPGATRSPTTTTGSGRARTSSAGPGHYGSRRGSTQFDGPGSPHAPRGGRAAHDGRSPNLCGRGAPGIFRESDKK